MKIQECRTNLRKFCLVLAVIFMMSIPAGALAATQFADEVYDLYEENAAELQVTQLQSETYTQPLYPQDEETEVMTQAYLSEGSADELTISYEGKVLFYAESALYQEIQPFSINHGAAFITSGQLLDANGNPQTVFGYYEPFRAHFTFSIPNEVPINAGDSMTVDIPSPLLLIGFPTANMTDPDGNIIGYFSVNPAAGIATVTFTADLPDGARGRQGSFWFGISWDRSSINVGDGVYIILPGGDVGQNYTVGDAIQISPDERLWKYGWFSDCGDYIAWMVRVNVAGDDIPNAVLHDTLPAGLELVQHYWGVYDVFIEVGQMMGETFIRQNSYFPDEYGRLTMGIGGFTVELGNLVRGSSTAMPNGSLPDAVTLRVIYRTRILEPQESFTNLARITGGGLDETITSTIRAEVGVEIRWYDIDFSAYKEVYGEIGYLEAAETFLFEIIDVETNQAVAWGRTVVNQSGVPIVIDFYFNADRTIRMSHTWSVLEDGQTYRLIEVGADGWKVTYLGGEGPEGNQFLVCESLVNEEDIIVIKFIVQNTEDSGSGGTPGNGNGYTPSGNGSTGNGGNTPGTSGDNSVGDSTPSDDRPATGGGTSGDGIIPDGVALAFDPVIETYEAEVVYEYLPDEDIPLAYVADNPSAEVDTVPATPRTGRVNPQTGDDFNLMGLILSLAGILMTLGVLVIIVKKNTTPN